MLVMHCDVCHKEIPEEIINFDDKQIKTYKLGKMKLEQYDCSKLFEHMDLCKDCAKLLSLLIDYEISKLRLNVSKLK